MGGSPKLSGYTHMYGCLIAPYSRSLYNIVKQLCCCSVAQSVQLFTTPWTAAHQSPLSSSVSQGLLNFMSIELVMLSKHIILCGPLLLLLSICPRIRDFSNELAVCIRWPKYWSFSFSISHSSKCSGLIFLKIDWFDLVVQGILRSLLQHHSSKASIL